MNTEPWQASVPPSLVSVLEHLRETFDDAHWGCGQTTRLFCYAMLHKETPDDPSEEHFRYLSYIKARVGVPNQRGFNEGIKSGTESAIFKAFYDLYLQGVSVQALQIFRDLLAIGTENETLLASSPLEWAEAQTTRIIRDKAHTLRKWVRDVCDKQPYDPEEGLEEAVQRAKWQAPNFLSMKPSGHQPWEFRISLGAQQFRNQPQVA